MSDAVTPLDRFAAQEATWPAAEVLDIGAWRVRHDAAAAGHRVNSARPLTTDDRALSAGLDAVAAFYAARGADALFQLPSGSVDDAISVLLEGRGFTVEAPTLSLTASIADVAATALSEQEPLYWIDADLSLAALHELWDEGAIGPERRAVMRRAPTAKRIGVRRDHRLIGGAFIGIAPEGAVLHALYVTPSMRRRSAGRDAVIGGARWALATEVGVTSYCIDVEADNAAAKALYSSLGAREIGGYRYFRKTAH